MAPESMAVSVRQREVSHNRNVPQLIQATPTSQFIEGTGRTLSVNNKGISYPGVHVVHGGIKYIHRAYSLQRQQIVRL